MRDEIRVREAPWRLIVRLGKSCLSISSSDRAKASYCSNPESQGCARFNLLLLLL